MFQIVTDACCDLPADLLDKYKVAYIPMFVELDGEEYTDDLGKTFDNSWFLEQLKENKQPTTSQINVGRYMSFLRSYAKKNIPVLYIAFSSGLSGSYESSLTAIEQLKEEYPDFTVTSFDTKTASLGQGMLVMEAVRLQKAGKTLEETVQWLTKYKMCLHSWFTVDDLKHLVHGGRITKTQAAIGGLLNIKPILNVDEKGRLQNVDKVHGRKKALQRLVNETSTRADLSIVDHFYIAYSGDEEALNKVVQQLNQRHPKTPITYFPLGPTIASHTGYGCIAVFSMGENRL
ncbi:DegV family protein [Tetragenococcus koreensis]|uniref:DegV family protein n=1 Tax=Tetragenococcus koreensis TaxID=290335 RepID=A0AAN4ZNM5_9ENTE|nr:DegV family protein [Tetragenococcus koreensis]AYW46318.1 DegV family protein [Tetragenococcus koreensis]MCF1585736.1 DegV family protein [Tetragenococcus koreensis]MCF1614850.1 DegV family protein [Tetragenococcus koreensis]MCF1616955.1 DegV family protein [Tetragenococcus koreensis]MCF1619371.1 DegV family protein [Tetragenococcus koreensis]